MLRTFFHLAAVSPTRRRAFQLVVLAHVATLLVLIGGMALSGDWSGKLAVGNTLLIAAIVEGALLIGWRLTQLPKSQALEFLLVTQLEPSRFLLAEGLVAIFRLAVVTLSGLPFLIFLYAQNTLDAGDVVTLLAMPLAWGLATGFGLAAWAYEPLEVRVWGERLAIVGILLYLVVGVLVGENLPRWLNVLPPAIASWLVWTLFMMHEFNPFGAMRITMTEPVFWHTAAVTLFGLGIAALGLWRASGRLLPHFHDLHYRPALLSGDRPRPRVGDEPLSWWAVKRVARYSGRINLWLAAGFTIAYSVFLLAGPWWPSWLGKNVFLTFETMGGVPMLTTALVLLAAVPAAFQYGLWDHNTQDRCRRLELLLLTDLDGRAYWEAAFAAAWNRGRGYFALAGILWTVGWLTGIYTFGQALSGAAAGVVVWGLYFALGFWSFSSGAQANTLGLTLTLLVPLATFVAYRLGLHNAASFLPPGTTYFAGATQTWWFLGPIAGGLAALAIGRWSLAHCDASLRRWYNLNHGMKAAD